LTWATATPVGLIAATLAMQELMRRFLINAFDSRSAIIAGYNSSSLELARRLKSNPGMRLDVKGFFDDRSSDRLGMESDAKLIGNLTDLGNYAKQHRTDVIFIALPIRHVKRVMNLLDDLARHHGVDLLRARHFRVRPHSGAFRRDSRHTRGRHVRNPVLRLPRRRQAADGYRLS
jgi:FlaA1/EpsC-like NDP-sugar epimerase